MVTKAALKHLRSLASQSLDKCKSISIIQVNYKKMKEYESIDRLFHIDARVYETIRWPAISIRDQSTGLWHFTCFIGRYLQNREKKEIYVETIRNHRIYHL